MAEVITTQAVVIGAGVVGLAVARTLALLGKEVVVIEKSDRFGDGISSRSSEVIHAGIYYPSSSLKTQLCLRGKQLLYEYCQQFNVSHQRLGKLIVATESSEHQALLQLLAQGKANGVEGLELLTSAELQHSEPQLNAYSAIYSPTSGIIDAQGLMLSLLGELESAGGMLVLKTHVASIEQGAGAWVLQTEGNSQCQIQARELINCAGLGAIDVARLVEGYDSQDIPDGCYAKGHYFSLLGASPFTHLVYPLPGASGLGIHATVDLAGRTRFGPDVVWVKEPDYRFDDVESLKAKFVKAVSSYYPALDPQCLSPDYVGVRPKLSRDGFADFAIIGPAEHGHAGLVHCFGIESPGLSASLAIAEHIAQQLPN